MNVRAGLTGMVVLSLFAAGPATAQNYGNPTFTGGNVGNVASAASGQTVFQVSSATGAVTVVSGNGARVSSGSANVTITVTCGNQIACATDTPIVTISSQGTPSGRAGALGSLTVTAGSATILLGPTGTNPVSLTLGPIGRNGSKTLTLGYNLPINATGTTGTASSGFTVGITRAVGGSGGAGSSNGTVTATVFRPISITKTADLAFGKVIRPTSGSGTVSLSTSGVLSVTGTGAGALASPAPTTGKFSVSGEGGQSVTVTIPSSFTMTSGANSLSVTTLSAGGGLQTLTNALGGAGSNPTAIVVGGSFPISSTTPPGAYSGTYSVTVQYN